MGRAAVSGLPRAAWSLVLRQDHVDRHHAAERIEQYWGEPWESFVLPSPTRGPAESTYQAIRGLGIALDTAIFVKDCDSGFRLEGWPLTNAVCVSSMGRPLPKFSDRSHVRTDELGRVLEIAEKRPISQWFSVGGYAFRTARIFLNAYEALAPRGTGEIFLSHVIAELLECGETFQTRLVTDYRDWGTREKWQTHGDLKAFPTKGIT